MVREDSRAGAAPEPVRLEYDRGTVLCTAWPAGVPPGGLPGMRWDERVGCFRAPARFHHSIREELQRLAYRVDDTVCHVSPPLPHCLTPELRPYQRAALAAWAGAGCRGVVVLPTGSGKTRVALAAIARQRCPALCIVPTIVLLEQWHRVLSSAFGVPIGTYGDGTRELRPVTVATYESAYRHMHDLGNRFELIVVDEAHHFGVGVRDEALEMSAARWRLGLTATPREGSGAAALAELVGPVVYELSIGDLAGRFLADLELIELRLGLDAEERCVYDDARERFRPIWAEFRGQVAPRRRDAFGDLRDGGWQEFLRWAGKSPEGREGIRLWHRARRVLALTRAKSVVVGSLLETHREARTLVFVADKTAAYRIAREHLIMPITADIKRAEREAMLAAFRDGEIRALVSARVLNEGFDVPEAHVGIVVGGGGGAREHTQRIGRLLRPAPGKRAVVYELVTRGTAEMAQARRRRHGLGGSLGAGAL